MKVSFLKQADPRPVASARALHAGCCCCQRRWRPRGERAGVPAAAGHEEAAPSRGPWVRGWLAHLGSECGAQAEDLPSDGLGNGRAPGNRSASYPSERRQVPESARVGTRKMVNYAWSGRSQRKLWWRSETVLTCKSIV